jgi:hypothetical protein
MIEVASHEGRHEATTAGVTRVDELDVAVERLGRMAATRPICEAERRLLEAARDCLASYASAAHDLADAGVATPRLMALIERGWREALTAFNRAEEERANKGQRSAPG